MSSKSAEPSAGQEGADKWWNFLWRAKIPNKVKLNMWRMFHNILPSNVNLHKKKIDVNHMCLICGIKNEDVSHTIFRCRRANELWSVILPQVRLFDSGGRIKALEILISAVGLSMEDFEMFCMTCWALWSDRNELVHDKAVLDVKSKV